MRIYIIESYVAYINYDSLRDIIYDSKGRR